MSAIPIDVAGHQDVQDRVEDYDAFVGTFEPLLGRSERWVGFCWLMRELLGKDSVVVVETGTLREPGNWKGDGQSTRIWQWLMERRKGCVISVDQDPKACELARRECDKVLVRCEDSVSFLRGFQPFAIDLLYLDTLEWGRSPGDEVDCWMNQVAELAAVWSRLPSGCIVASDDSQAIERGKPVLTRKLFEALGVPPILDGYIVAWRKP